MRKRDLITDLGSSYSIAEAKATAVEAGWLTSTRADKLYWRRFEYAGYVIRQFEMSTGETVTTHIDQWRNRETGRYTRGTEWGWY